MRFWATPQCTTACGLGSIGLRVKGGLGFRAVRGSASSEGPER